MKKKNIINFSEICEAMEDNSPEFRHYLDLQTGEVIIDSDYYGEPDREKLFNKIEQNSERYNLIPTISSYEGYQDMENFIYTVGNEKLQNELSRVIQGRGAFRRFKDVLSQNPEEQIRWYDFKNKIIQQKAKEWLEGLGMKVREKDTKDNWVEERIQKKKKLIDDTINMFVELASKIDGIIEMSLFGSLATGKKRIAKDIDFLVVIEDVSCIDELALCHRKVLGKYHSSPDTFVFTKDKKFLGNICHRKECKARSIDCQVSGCGKIKYIRRYPNFNIKLDDILKSKPKLLYLNPKYKIESNDKNRY